MTHQADPSHIHPSDHRPTDALSDRPVASPDLMPLVYERAREIAHRTLHGDRAQEWIRASSLVHAAFIRLLQSGHPIEHAVAEEQAKLLALLTKVMRRTVVDVARAARAEKRGFAIRISLHTQDIASPKPSIDLIEIDDAMSLLAEHCEESAKVAELRLWGAMEFEQIALALAIPMSRVRSRWNRAKAFLAKDLSDREQGGAT